MCQSPLHEFLLATPKVENHVHVEGTLEPDMLFTFAERNNIDLPNNADYASPQSLATRYGQFTCLDDFLSYLYFGASVLMTAQDFEELAWTYFFKANDMRIRHLEVSFDPQMHTVRGVSYDTVVAGLESAKRRAMEELGLSVEYIACIHRHVPLADSNGLLDTVLERGHLLDGTICGIGLVSSEKPFPPKMFADLYQRVAPTGTKLTAHVGEEVGPEAVRDALKYLNVSRVDHGLTSVQDPALLKELAENGTLLTLCPWSNVALDILPELSQAPVRQFLDAGVRFSINSDDPAYDGCYLQEVYCRVQEAFNLTLQEWDWIIRGSIQGSWCQEARKHELLSELNSAVGRFGGHVVRSEASG